MLSPYLLLRPKQGTWVVVGKKGIFYKLIYGYSQCE